MQPNDLYRKDVVWETQPGKHENTISASGQPAWIRSMLLLVVVSLAVVAVGALAIRRTSEALARTGSPAPTAAVSLATVTPAAL